MNESGSSPRSTSSFPSTGACDPDLPPFPSAEKNVKSDLISVNPRTFKISWPPGKDKNIAEAEEFAQELRSAALHAERLMLERIRKHQEQEKAGRELDWRDSPWTKEARLEVREREAIERASFFSFLWSYQPEGMKQLQNGERPTEIPISSEKLNRKSRYFWLAVIVVLLGLELCVLRLSEHLF
jgi:hypothetical protein